jgi:hypothetical protein
VIAKEGGGYKGGRDRNRKAGRGQEQEGGQGTGTGKVLVWETRKQRKCDGSKWDQMGGSKNEAETNWRQTGSKLELAKK